MMLKSFLVGVFCCISTLAPSESFRSETQIIARDIHHSLFSWRERLDFECHFSSPDTLTFILKNLRGEGQNENEVYLLDTKEEDETHFELLCLKHFIDVPIEIKLTSNYELIKPILQFEELQKITLYNHPFLSEALLEKLLSALLSPKRYDEKNNLLSFPLYFPIESTLTLSPNLSLQKKESEIFFDQELSFEALYEMDSEPKPLYLESEVSGKIKWKHHSPFCSSFELTHLSKEKETKPLFDTPLQFDYSLTLQQIPCDSFHFSN